MLATIFLVKEDHREINPLPSAEDSKAISQRLQPSVRIIVGAMLATAMLVLLANMSIEPIITVYLEMLKVPKTRLVLDAGFIMAASAFGSVVMAPRLGRWPTVSVEGRSSPYACLPPASYSYHRRSSLDGGSWVSCASSSVCLLLGFYRPSRRLFDTAFRSVNPGKSWGHSQSSQYAGQVIGPLMGAIGAHFGMRSVFITTSAIGTAANWLCQRAEIV